jgi:rhodanese-related sulfurtransferase
MTDLQSISPHELDELRRAGQPVHLLDVRTPSEFQAVHADLARNVPLDHLDPARLGTQYRTEHLFIISRSDLRARQACERLRAAGCENVIPIEGGTEAWEQSGLPVVRKQSRWEIDRRTLLSVLLLVLVVALIAWLIDPILAVLVALLATNPVFSLGTDLFRPRRFAR